MDPEFCPAFNEVIEFLDGLNFHYQSIPDRNLARFSVAITNCTIICSILIMPEIEQVSFDVFYPFMVHDMEKRTGVCELIARANYGLPVGNFSLDMNDGEVRFHIGHIFGDDHLSPEVLGRYLRIIFCTASRYFPAFMQYIHSGLTPEDAIYLAELDFHVDRVESPSEKKTPKRKRKPRGDDPSTA